MTLILSPELVAFSMSAGRSQLPIVELEKAKVRGSRKQVRLRKDSAARKTAGTSFGNRTSDLAFTAWNFFHAAKKTELSSPVSPKFAWQRAMAFALEHESSFIWNTGNFRRIDRDIFSLEDFAEAGLAARVGEAIAYLTMIEWGYVYWDRCATVWRRAVKGGGWNHVEQLRAANYLKSKVASGRPSMEPDFVFEKATGVVALMEAKGSFVNPETDNPTVKSDLRQALLQLDAWSEVLAPAPAASFAIGTYLRDHSDSSSDPSLIAFVDPPPEEGQLGKPAEMPRSLVRRCNYGAWLMGMGMITTANALQDRAVKEPEIINLPIVRYGGKSFAVTVDGWEAPTRSPTPFLDPYGYGLHSALLGRRVLVTGIEVNVLRRLESAISTRDDDLQDLPRSELESESSAGSGSMMPDGSFVGVIDYNEIESFETFKL